ncbi:MAG: Ku protein [Acidimicrobiia bacterium]
MPSTIWSGSISFGLVTVPVRLTPATRSRDVSFNQLEEGTGARIRYRRVSEATGEEVPAERIVKGYEIAKGRYVIVDRAELDAMAPKSTRAIDIEDFVDLDQIDPIYFESPYYVLPDKNAAKPYRLLVETMKQMRKVAIGRVVIRSKEHLVAIRPLDGLLCVETMRYADEVISRDELGPVAQDVDVSEKELAMARQLIESLAGEFDASRYHDEYREQLLELIERKAAGEEIVARPAAEAPAKVLDLMAALEASLQRVAGEGGSGDGAPAPKAAARGAAPKAAAKKATTAAKTSGAKPPAAAAKRTDGKAEPVKRGPRSKRTA